MSGERTGALLGMLLPRVEFSFVTVTKTKHTHMTKVVVCYCCEEWVTYKCLWCWQLLEVCLCKPARSGARTGMKTDANRQTGDKLIRAV